MKKISTVIPMYQEEKVVQECYERFTCVLSNLENYEYEIIFINDGSKDNTLSLLKEIAKKDLKVKIISFSRNFRTPSSSNSRSKRGNRRCNCNNRCRSSRSPRTNSTNAKIMGRRKSGYIWKKKNKKR